VLPPEPTSLAGIHTTARQLLADLQNYSPESGIHSRRLCSLAHRLALTMGLDRTELITLRYGTMLHDVGKLSVPLEVLHKVGKPTATESTILRRHSEDGASIAWLRRLPEEICNAILFHHERWDGTGYPCGLRAEAIPRPARIIAVVDTFDTIVNKRCYRDAQAVSIARAEIVRCAGTQFDPHVAASFVSLLEVLAARRGELAA
jgi:putative nucleotidyltransferase with HDIG domain